VLIVLAIIAVGCLAIALVVWTPDGYVQYRVRLSTPPVVGQVIDVYKAGVRIGHVTYWEREADGVAIARVAARKGTIDPSNARFILLMDDTHADCIIVLTDLNVKTQNTPDGLLLLGEVVDGDQAVELRQLAGPRP
jgi:hypothetical protein